MTTPFPVRSVEGGTNDNDPESIANTEGQFLDKSERRTKETTDPAWPSIISAILQVATPF